MIQMCKISRQGMPIQFGRRYSIEITTTIDHQ